MFCIICKKTIKQDSIFCKYCGAKQPERQQKATPKYKKSENGSGYAYKRGNTWTIRYRKYAGQLPDGTSAGCIERTKGGFKTKAEATAYLSSLSVTPKKEMNLSVAYYWQIIQRDSLPSLSHSKQVNYTTAYNRLKMYHTRQVADLTVSDLRQSTAQCQTYYPAHDIKQLWQKIFDLAAADNQEIKRDLPSFIILPAKQETEQQAFTAEEVSNVYAAYQNGDRFAGFILLMIYTSMMPGEFMKLQRSMFDLPHHQIVGAGIKTKKRKQSAIVYPEWMSPIVQDLLGTPDDPDAPVHNFGYYEQMSKAFKQTIEACGCRKTLTPYACRHTTQTILGLDPTTAPAARAAVMRHSIQEEERYTHIEQVFARQAANQMPTPDELLQKRNA